VGSYTSTKREKRRIEMSEPAYNATMNMVTMVGMFFNTVSQEENKDKALAYLSSSVEGLGEMFGKMTKEQMKIKTLDVATIKSIMEGMMETYGLTSEFEVESKRLLVNNYKCPFYDGLKTAGFDHAAIEEFCRSGPGTMVNSFFRQIDPTVEYKLEKFRSSPEDFCVEEFVVKS
jgi:hypothetical protein